MKGIALFSILTIISTVFGLVYFINVPVAQAACGTVGKIRYGTFNITTYDVLQSGTGCGSVNGNITATVQGNKIYLNASNLSITAPSGYTFDNKVVATRTDFNAGQAAVAADDSECHDSPSCSLNINFYDGSATSGFSITNTYTYHLYIFVKAGTNSTDQLMSLGTATYTPTVASVGNSDGNISLEGPYNSSSQNISPNPNGMISLPLTTTLLGALAGYINPDGTRYATSLSNLGMTQFQITGPGISIDLLKTHISDGSNDTKCTAAGATIQPGVTCKVSGDNLIVTIANYKLVNNANTFKVSMKYYIGKLLSADLAANAIPKTATYSFNYNAATKTVSGGTSSDSATDTAKATAAAGNSGNDSGVFDKCVVSISGTGWASTLTVAYQLVAKPLCTLVSIVVAFSTDLATYAINSFLKPALGLS